VTITSLDYTDIPWVERLKRDLAQCRSMSNSMRDASGWDGTLPGAVNCDEHIGQMRAERDSLRSTASALRCKVEELEAALVEANERAERHAVEHRAAVASRETMRSDHALGIQRLGEVTAQRDSALQRAAAAEHLALERYDEIEELRASMGEPAQRYVTAVETLRKERDQAVAVERERIAAWLDGVADASATNIKAAFAATWATAIRAQGRET
jgi:hypothetical protein